MENRTIKILLSVIALGLCVVLLRPLFAPNAVQAGQIAPSALPTATWMKLSAPKSPGVETWVNLEHAASIGFYKSGRTTYAQIGTSDHAYATTDPREMAILRSFVTRHHL